MSWKDFLSELGERLEPAPESSPIPPGFFAGKLIMDAGLRGFTVGGASVSEKHCGFVVNNGDATAADVCRLMHEVSDTVKAKFGVELEPEVKILGTDF